MKTLLIGTLILTNLFHATAHVCGPATIEIEVGQTCPWRITADRTETVSVYSPALTGATDVVRVHPTTSGSFQAHHGDFTLTGLKPGTATLTVNWSYAPTMASGTCTVTITVKAATGQRTVTEGRLSAEGSSQSISARVVARMMETFIPPQSPKLLIFAQCFGGSTALEPGILGLTNTCVLSATAPGIEAHYGGYHDDAARNLAPGAGKTAADVHRAGSVGRDALGLNDDGREFDKDNIAFSSEWPLITGTVGPENFSLAPTSATGDIRSRHVIFYAGLPSTRTPRLMTVNGTTIPEHGSANTEVTDATDRDVLVRNFQGQTATTVRSVGGEPDPSNPSAGQDGWNYPGNESGLLRAIREAGDAIRQSGHPDKEQFILFVGDHGVLGTRQFPLSPQQIAGRPAQTLQGLPAAEPNRFTFAGFEPFGENSTATRQIQDELNAVPGIVVFLDFMNFPIALTPTTNGTAPVLAPRGLELELITQAGVPPIRLTDFTQEAFDLDADGTLGSTPDEGLQVFFPVDKTTFIDKLAGGLTSITVINQSPRALVVFHIGQISGAIERLSPFDSSLPVRLEQPRLLIGDQLELRLRGGPGLDYVIESTPDFVSWSFLREIRLISETTGLILPINRADKALFLRARQK